MIIAPNRFFLNYISEVLPELGVRLSIICRQKNHQRQLFYDLRRPQPRDSFLPGFNRLGIITPGSFWGSSQ